MALMHQMLTFYNATPEKSLYHDILTVMFAHLQELPSLSIERIAELCLTSTASVSRLVREMGFRNYTDFRSSLWDLLRNYPLHNRSMPSDMVSDPYDLQGSFLRLLQRDLEQIQRTFDHEIPVQVASWINGADAVMIYSIDVPTLCVEHLQYDLIMGGKKTKLYTRPESMVQCVKHLEPNALVLIFAGRSIPAQPLMRLLHDLREIGARSVMITPLTEPMLTSLADMLVHIPSSSFAIEMMHYHIFLTFVTLEYRSRYIDAAGTEMKKEHLTMDIKQEITKITEKITKDPKFKEEFQKNPVHAVENALGVDIPDGMVEKVVDGVKAKLTGDKLGGVADKLKSLF